MSLALHLKLFHAIRRWHLRHKTKRQLSTLTDHMLRDIGLERHDIESAVEDLPHADPTMPPASARRRPLPADAGPSLGSHGLYR